VVEVELYSRQNIEGFFKWKDDSALEHFSDEINCEERAKNYADLYPRSEGFITFKSDYRGKRYFWVERGQANEIDPMECFLRVREMKLRRAKNLIQQTLALTPKNSNV
jgi:hypothetical protein